MSKALVGLEAGRLVERIVPCLFVLERISGTWTVVKVSPYLQHVSGRNVEALLAGWYQLTARGLVLLEAGDVVHLPKKGKLAWVTGPWP